MRRASLETALSGISYADNGRERSTGVDCWGFFRLGRIAAGLSVPPENVIGEAELRSEAFRRGKESPDWTRLDAPEPFCLCLMEREGRPTHCGIVAEDGLKVLHINAAGVHSTPLDSRYVKAYEKTSFYRYNR